jgi:hypothetical protein
MNKRRPAFSCVKKSSVSCNAFIARVVLDSMMLIELFLPSTILPFIGSNFQGAPPQGFSFDEYRGRLWERHSSRRVEKGFCRYQRIN